MLTALAAEQAGSTRGEDIASALIEITHGGQRCTDYASCLAIIDGGGDVNYDGLARAVAVHPGR